MNRIFTRWFRCKLPSFDPDISRKTHRLHVLPLKENHHSSDSIPLFHFTLLSLPPNSHSLSLFQFPLQSIADPPPFPATMQYKNLGRSGLKVSQLSYGAWVSFGNQLDVREAKSLLQCCRDHGVNFFDNAEVYANGRAEEIMGQAIRELGWKRSDIVVSTKIFWGGPGPNDKGLSRKHIVEGTKASLKRLDMEYVDVIYCHRPDSSTPIEETVRAMNYVIDKGWAFYWGTSEWSAQQITEAWGIAERLDLVGPIVEQPEYNLLSRHKVSASIRIFSIVPWCVLLDHKNGVFSCRQNFWWGFECPDYWLIGWKLRVYAIGFQWNYVYGSFTDWLGGSWWEI